MSRRSSSTSFNYDAIREMDAKGVRHSAIAAAMGCSTRTVNRAIRDDNNGGVESRKRRPYTMQLNDEGDLNARYRDLASAVVVLAVNDLREAVRREMRTGKGAAEVASLERWFSTPWAQTLCGACGVDAPSVPAIVRRQEAGRLAERLGA